jgi:oxygen-independent coproporphyrinogen-3 oxidase
MRKPYLGVGPSAHSYDVVSRSWNVSNNPRYIKSIEKGVLPLTTEILTTENQYNEYIMTRLRTAGGISIDEIGAFFGLKFQEYLKQNMQQHIALGLLICEGDLIKATKKGKFLTDGIAADLFMI